MQTMAIAEEVEDPVNDYYSPQHPDTMLNNYGMTHLVNTSSSSLIDSPASQSRRHMDEGSLVTSAYIDSHILEGDQYWFIVFATLANGKHRVLYRLYEGNLSK